VTAAVRPDAARELCVHSQLQLCSHAHPDTNLNGTEVYSFAVVRHFSSKAQAAPFMRTAREVPPGTTAVFAPLSVLKTNFNS
jgi:hypothetical protein